MIYLLLSRAKFVLFEMVFKVEFFIDFIFILLDSILIFLLLLFLFCQSFFNWYLFSILLLGCWELSFLIEYESRISRVTIWSSLIFFFYPIWSSFFWLLFFFLLWQFFYIYFSFLFHPLILNWLGMKIFYWA